MFRKIVIKRIDYPSHQTEGDKLEWFFESVGLRRGRDIQDNSTRIFRKLLESMESGVSARSEDIANELNLKQACVNHHIRNLIESGIVIREKARLNIRGGSLRRCVEELKRDSDRVFEDLLKIADYIDNQQHGKY